MESHSMDRDILQGRVYDDPKEASRAAKRAEVVAQEMRSKDLLIRAGWFLPAVAVITVGGVQVLGGASWLKVVAYVVIAFLVTATVYLARRRQLTRVEHSLKGNRTRAQDLSPETG